MHFIVPGMHSKRTMLSPRSSAAPPLVYIISPAAMFANSSCVLVQELQNQPVLNHRRNSTALSWRRQAPIKYTFDAFSGL